MSGRWRGKRNVALAAEQRALPLAPAAAVHAAAPVARNPWFIVAVVMVGNFLGPLYSSVTNVAIPNLIAAFGSDVDTMQWVVSGYMLGYSITMPLAGWFTDAYGRRRMFLIGIVVFTVASILTALAWDVPSLIVFRILQSIGGGILSPTSMAIIADVVPQRQRGRALGMWGLGMMLAPALGPWISGTVIDAFDDWRFIFLLGIPIGAAALPLAFLFIPERSDRAGRRGSFDAPGALLLSAALAMLLVPLTQVDRIGWDDDFVRVSFALSAIAFVAFVYRELTTDSPMLDLSLFLIPTFAVAVGLRAAMGMAYYFGIFLLPLYTQTVLNWPAALSGLILVPGGIATAIIMPFTGRLTDRIGARWLVFVGMLGATIGSFMFAQIDLSWDANRMALVNVLRMGALGFFFTPLTAAAYTVVSRARAGQAAALLNTVWQVSGSLGIAVGQTYLTAQTAVHLARDAGDAVLARPAVGPLVQGLSESLVRQGLPAEGARRMLYALVSHLAQVQAYGDTFLIAALLMAAATPFGLLLGRKHNA
jgi:EmrB/QacA subfamily drug resistance transporter